MASLNKVYLVGNLTRDPEVRYVAGGQAVATMSVATNRKWKSPTGEAKEEVTYVTVQAWGKLAEAAREYLAKGSLLLVEGRLHLEQWTAAGGEKRSALKVMGERLQFLSPKRTGAPGAAEAHDHTADDDIPF